MAKKHKILMFVANEFEDSELLYPRIRLMEEGMDVIVAGEKKGETYKGKHGVPITADISLSDVSVKSFSALVIPGGYAPDKLRTNEHVKKIVKQFNQQQKLIAFICHAGWIPVSAGVIDGVKCTSYHTIKDDMVNAGAKWVDKAVVVDKNFISSRNPDDLPDYCQAIIKFLG